MEIVLGIILILASVFLIVSVLLQSGKSNNHLSGAIAGGAETFFGKSKAETIDRKLSKLTAIVAVVFAVLVIAVYLLQDTTDYSGYIADSGDTNVSDTADSDAVDSDAADSEADLDGDSGEEN